MERSQNLILAALALLIIGVVLPFMMVLDLLESTLFLSFLSAISSTTGFIMGFVGIAKYVGARRQRR